MLHKDFLWFQRVRTALLLQCTDFLLWWLLLLQSAGSRCVRFSGWQLAGTVVAACWLLGRLASIVVTCGP